MVVVDVDVVVFVVDGFCDVVDVVVYFEDDWVYVGVVLEFECCCEFGWVCVDDDCGFLVYVVFL